MKGKTAKMAYVWSKEKPEGRGEAGQWKRQLKKQVEHFSLLQQEVRSLHEEREIGLLY